MVVVGVVVIVSVVVVVVGGVVSWSVVVGVVLVYAEAVNVPRHNVEGVGVLGGVRVFPCVPLVVGSGVVVVSSVVAVVFRLVVVARWRVRVAVGAEVVELSRVTVV